MDLQAMQMTAARQLGEVRDMLAAAPAVWSCVFNREPRTQGPLLAGLGCDADGNWVLRAADGLQLVASIAHAHYSAPADDSYAMLFLYESEADAHCALLTADHLSESQLRALKAYSETRHSIESERRRLARIAVLEELAKQLIAPYGELENLDIAHDGKKITLTFNTGGTMVIECRDENTQPEFHPQMHLYVNGIKISQA